VTPLFAHEKEPNLRPCLPCNTRTHLTGASGVLKSIFLLLILLSCVAVPNQINKEYILDKQSKSNDFIEINGNKYKLKIYAWNDFRGFFPSGVNINYYLSPEDENNKDEINAKIVELLIFHDNEMWKPWIKENESTINRGPNWKTGTYIVAIAKVITERGESIFLKSGEEYISGAF
jgi:uncharacterized protein (UPF0333 family)